MFPLRSDTFQTNLAYTHTYVLLNIFRMPLMCRLLQVEEEYTFFRPVYFLS